eukprot:1113660-Lingulodinium_polyedra.AAC.1
MPLASSGHQSVASANTLFRSICSVSRTLNSGVALRSMLASANATRTCGTYPLRCCERLFQPLMC